MELEFNIRGEARGRPREGLPFNLLVLGNFGGQALSAGTTVDQMLAARRIIQVDLDNADQLWTQFSPFLQLQLGSAAIEFSPRDIEDFHPDELFSKLPVFGKLRDLRNRLQNPETAQTALDEIHAAGAVIEGEVVDNLANTTVHEDAGRMFERLLGQPPQAESHRAGAAAELQKLDAYIRELVAPHIVQQPDPREETAIHSVDLAIAELMRRILHHEEFQALESSWRSLFGLVSELELDENLQLHVCDIRREELLAGLPQPGTELQHSVLLQLLVERRRQAADDTPYSVIVGDYYFGPQAEDIALLTALGAAAALNGGVFLAGAKPALLGCETTAGLADTRHWSFNSEGKDLWGSLRTSPVADRIGLALPRVLARLPYGEQSEPIDRFAFEEMPQRNHEHYLWANPAYACARLLAQSFTRQGWDMQPGDDLDLGTLPAHHYLEEGESRLQPCAELLLSESTMVAMLDQGLMPLISYRNQNTAVLGRFQSIAAPAAALSGPWSR
jgi:type VI secretion system protein ImpC